MTSPHAHPVAIVTGGAQNIGLAIANTLAADGYTIVIADMNPPATDTFTFHETDVTREPSVKSLMDRVNTTFGRLDTLINNAGICIESSIREMSVDAWSRIMAVNVQGVFLTTKHAFNLLSNGAAPHPTIVNISSIEGHAANPAHSAYATSKGAVASFTHNTALEYGPYGIRCNAVAPGWINTPFNDAFLNQYPDRAKVEADIVALHPVGRLGRAQDVADTVAYLASNKSAFITGQEIVVAGGRMAKLPTPDLS